ncbi:unnamed protein product [Acanthosepion pharaonis]|uniref:Uncharacterized protein n=1 Tax=Acanthosepion pharaonis TaxID=158019 RepID=A0A812B9R9_ACAPH|nr:unnamed protein product [Sepia pharaonis]
MYLDVERRKYSFGRKGICLYLSISVFFYLYIYIPIYIYDFYQIYISFYLSIYLSIKIGETFLFFPFFIYLSVFMLYLSIYLFYIIYICLYTYLYLGFNFLSLPYFSIFDKSFYYLGRYIHLIYLYSYTSIIHLSIYLFTSIHWDSSIPFIEIIQSIQEYLSIARLTSISDHQSIYLYPIYLPYLHYLLSLLISIHPISIYLRLSIFYHYAIIYLIPLKLFPYLSMNLFIYLSIYLSIYNIFTLIRTQIKYLSSLSIYVSIYLSIYSLSLSSETLYLSIYLKSEHLTTNTCDNLIWI